MLSPSSKPTNGTLKLFLEGKNSHKTSSSEARHYFGLAKHSFKVEIDTKSKIPIRCLAKSYRKSLMVRKFKESNAQMGDKY